MYLDFSVAAEALLLKSNYFGFTILLFNFCCEAEALWNIYYFGKADVVVG